MKSKIIALLALVAGVLGAGIAMPAAAQSISRYTPRQPVSCYPIATDASVRGCLTSAQASGSPMVIYLPSGVITLNSALPAVSNVTLRCAPPILNANSASPGDGWAPSEGGSSPGTWFKAATSQSYAAISANKATEASWTYLDAVNNFNVFECGFDGFAYAIDIGATNHVGLWNSYISHNYFINNKAAYNLVNTIMDYVVDNQIRASSEACGYIVGDVPGGASVYQPGNVQKWTDFCSSPAYTYGLVVKSTPGTILDVIKGQTLQVNKTNPASFSETVNSTSGSTAWPVADTSKYPVGSWFHPSGANTTTAGLVVGRGYVVLSRSASSGAGTITFANYPEGAAISAAASTSVTFNDGGVYPDISFLGGGSIQGNSFLGIDIEGSGSGWQIGLMLDNVTTTDFVIDAFPAHNAYFISRNGEGYNTFLGNMQNATMDVFGTAGSDYCNISRSTVVNQGCGMGFGYDTVKNVSGIDIAINGHFGQGFDLEANFGNSSYRMQPRAAIGQYYDVFGPSCGNSLAGFGGGLMQYSGGTACTWTLPTQVQSGTNYPSNTQGFPFFFYDTGNGPLTITASGTDGINFKYTSITLGNGQAAQCFGGGPVTGNNQWLCTGLPIQTNFQVGGAAQAAGQQDGTLSMAKQSSDNATAPGAGYANFKLVPGTNAGTCKLIVYAGTSTTPATIADNIGGGC